MEAAPPSYQAATVIDAWAVIAPYVHRYDLVAASRVCSQWHRIFAARLWGRPATSWTRHNVEERQALLSRFWTSLPATRSAVRSLTHTLDLSHAELDDDDFRDDAWLETALELLPQLQSLVVRGLSRFDHAALQPLMNVEYSLNLRLLDASQCENATPPGLSALLQRAEGLLYVDLSRTTAARHDTVLLALGHLPSLKVLKLKGTGLRDRDLEILAGLVKFRLRSLDVRDNRLTGPSLRVLQRTCCRRERFDQSLSSMVERLMAFEPSLRQVLEADFVNQLSIEDAPPMGLSHLYITGNPIGEQALIELLDDNSFCVLDAVTSSDLPTCPQLPLELSSHSQGLTTLTHLQIDYRTAIDISGNASSLAGKDENRSAREGPSVKPQLRLDPAWAPRLETLVLCNVPSRSKAPFVVNGLIALITECAKEAHRARTLARGTCLHADPIKLAAVTRTLFALETLVLKVRSTGSQQRLSTTDDSYTELWSAAAPDFSFFEPGVMHGSPDQAPKTSLHRSEVEHRETKSDKRGVTLDAEMDTIACIAEFRGAKRAEYQACLASGLDENQVEGHWPGVVKVIRPEEQSFHWTS